MHIRIPQNVVHGAILIGAAVLMMVSCSQRPARAASIAGAPASPYVTADATAQPTINVLGQCTYPVLLPPHAIRSGECVLSSTTGLVVLPSDVVQATVLANTPNTRAWLWLVSPIQFTFNPQWVVVSFYVENLTNGYVNAAPSVSAVAFLNAKTMTPAVAAAGVE